MDFTSRRILLEIAKRFSIQELYSFKKIMGILKVKRVNSRTIEIVYYRGHQERELKISVMNIINAIKKLNYLLDK